jgi:DNA-binding MarR family transcriptional regulator
LADLGPLGDILGLRIRLAQGAVQRHFAEHFSGLGLTQKQVSVLWLAGEGAGVAQKELALRLQMDRATTMAIVHSLEKRGLLARRRAEDDGRVVVLAPTAEGAAALAAARVAIGEHEAWLKGRYSAEEVATLTELLGRIHR